MNIKHFVTELNMGLYEKPSESVEKVCSMVRGFSQPKLMMILNMAVRHLAIDEYYMEIGVFRGRTLIGALINNPSKKAVAVDNFSEFKELPNGYDELRNNIFEFKMERQVTFYNKDSKEFLRTSEEYLHKVGVYFYDANHDTDQGLAALESGIKFLANKALIVLDDISGIGIWRTVVQFLSNHIDEAEIIFAMGTNDFPHSSPYWHNGIIVMEWNRKSVNEAERISIIG